MALTREGSKQVSLERLLDSSKSPAPAEDLYTSIDWPPPPADRPYLYINMVSTTDGKIVLGRAGGPAKGVGGPTDQKLFRRLQTVCDAAMIGSGTLRASNVIYPSQKPRFVVTRTGELPLDNRFFTDARDKAYVLAPETLPEAAANAAAGVATVLRFGAPGVDLRRALEHLRTELGIRYLLCEGGADLNDQLIRAGLADELFLTLTPKIKGGVLPTPVTGDGFPPGQFQALNLISVYHDESELYLRYRIEHP